MNAMSPMNPDAHFVLLVNDANDPESSLILGFSPGGDEELRELGNSFGGTREDFRWLASSMATFHQKCLFDVDGKLLVQPSQGSIEKEEVPQRPQPANPLEGVEDWPIEDETGDDG